MYKIIQGSTWNLLDVEAFIHTLNTLNQNPIIEARTLFKPDRELFVSRAPGRLDVMGGIADYSGSLVLQLPIKEATLVALQRDPERKFTIISLGNENNDRTAYFEMSLTEFEQSGKPVAYETARTYFQKDPATHWAAYVAGAFLVLMRERSVNFHNGAHILIHSDVPAGKGVSSSAALEVATMKVIAAAFNVSIEPREMALLCQKVENLVVGAPCGIMDQMTAVFGEKNRLMALLCQPAELKGWVDIPDEITFWGIDSGERHSVSGSDYTTVRVGAFMGYRMIADMAALNVETDIANNNARIIDPIWDGYLANLTPSEFEQTFSTKLPEKMAGDKFLSRYGGTTDPVTHIQPEKLYAVRQPTAHPIYEHFRVRAFAELLQGKICERNLELLGELMYQSHASYSACGLGSMGTNRLVEMVREIGTKRGLFGAKITGGGSGGTVVVLGGSGCDPAVKDIAENYEIELGYRPYIFKESSIGAEKFNYLSLR